MKDAKAHGQLINNQTARFERLYSAATHVLRLPFPSAMPAFDAFPAEARA